MLLAVCSLVSGAGIKGKHTSDPEPQGGRRWWVAEVSKTERTVLMGEDGKAASLSESSSVLLPGLNGNTEAGNLIEEGVARAVPAPSPRRPSRGRQHIWYGSSFSVMGLFGAWPGWGTLRRVATELGQQVLVDASVENARSTISASGHTRARTLGN